VKKAAIERQKGVCAFCGVTLDTPWTRGHQLLIGHGMAPLGIDKQGGSSNTWVQLVCLR
jgi:hypothetical protein